MPERTSSGSLSLERIARTLLRNRRETDRASVTSVSRTITASDVGSSNRSRIESVSMTITSRSVLRANDTRLATVASLRHSLSSPLAQFDRNRLDLAGANQPDLQNITDLRGGKRILDCIHVFYCFSAHFEKEISQQHPGLFCGPI